MEKPTKDERGDDQTPPKNKVSPRRPIFRFSLWRRAFIKQLERDGDRSRDLWEGWNYHQILAGRTRIGLPHRGFLGGKLLATRTSKLNRHLINVKSSEDLARENEINSHSSWNPATPVRK
jgi:hypothetical protein